MFEILVLSGKGGTGKTSLTAAFAHLAAEKSMGDTVICDLDVDAPDLHLILHPQQTVSEDFVSGHEAVILEEKCEQCGICTDMCHFGAVSATPLPRVNPMKCEGCKVCVTFCPVQAIAFRPKHCGEWYLSESRFGPMVHARLFPGEENSGRLVSLLKQRAKELAEQKSCSLVLSDGPPGIGCPVISSLSGASLVVNVSEPTPSGLHDLERVTELCEHFRIPSGVIINKADLNEKISTRIEEFCAEKKMGFLGHLPHNPVITEAMIRGQAVTEYESKDFSEAVRKVWNTISEMKGKYQ
ncbi:MAG: ATP-binding protein [Desulfococcaceae bacterium]|nr:ATP-binding protein [Desulfococcaceae bacterium]